MLIETVKAVAELMVRYELDEFASEDFTLKKSQHRPARPAPTDAELLKQHLTPLPAEPWNQIPQADADQWASGHAAAGGPVSP